MPRWQRRAVAASHAALYALMLLLPVTGWLLASASPVQDLLQMQNLVFGRVALPDPFVPGSDALDRTFRTLHAGAAIALAALLALHAAAALRHQFVDRDGLPARRGCSGGRACTDRGQGFMANDRSALGLKADAAAKEVGSYRTGPT